MSLQMITIIMFFCSNLRIDAIGQLLTYANVHAGSRVMVAESCIGLLLGAVIDRMQGKNYTPFVQSGNK